MFSVLSSSRTSLNFLVKFIFLSASLFNLDHSKILSFGKGLKDLPTTNQIWNQLVIKAWITLAFSSSHNVFESLLPVKSEIT